MARDLNLEVRLSAIDKITAPLRSITQGSGAVAKALKASRDQLKELNDNLSDVSAYRELADASKATAARLADSNKALGELGRKTAATRQQLAPLNEMLQESARRLDSAREKSAEIKGALSATRNELALQRDKWQATRAQIAAYNDAVARGVDLSAEQRAEMQRLIAEQVQRKTSIEQLETREKSLATQYTESNRKLKLVRDGHSAVRAEIHKIQKPHQELIRQYEQAREKSRQLGEQYGQQQRKLKELDGRLGEAGIKTNRLGVEELNLKRKLEQTNTAIQQQEERLKRATVQQQRLAKAQQAYRKTQELAGNMAMGGAASMANAYALSRPLAAAVGAFAPAEDAATQLKVSMMDAGGQVAEDFTRISELAKNLGDRLPGTTAQFTEMLTMLRRQGISAQSILNGTGEAAAYLGVQLKLPSDQAAEFAAKMQDATRTTEGDMMGLMDMIQRTFYLGMDPTNMMQGFSKLSPAMSILGKSGLGAANDLAPLLVMMDQTSMAGESAGNAIRKVFQAGFDTKKMGDANDMLAKKYKAGFTLDFTDGKGNFGGLENLFAQLEKLKKLNKEAFTSVVKEIFGDDSETQQVVETMMNKGLGGYQEIVGKMQAQADLRMRVNEQLQTLTNVMDAASGSWTNAQAEFGAAVAPELKEIIQAAGELANRIGAWARENPKLAATLVKVTAGIAAAAAAGGALAIGMAGLLGPFAMVKLAMATFGIKALPLLGLLPKLGMAFKAVGTALWVLAANPVAITIAAIAAAVGTAAFLIWSHWGTLGPKLKAVWSDVTAWFSQSWAQMLVDVGIFLAKMGALWVDLFTPVGWAWAGFSALMNLIGVEMPLRFTEMGKNAIAGLIQGLKSAFPDVKAVMDGISDSMPEWMKEKLGIHSPSRVFAELGGFTMAGLEQGLLAGQGGPLGAVVGMGKQLVAAGAVALGMGAGSAMAIDNRPPLAAGTIAAPMVVQGDTLNVTINATPGTDTAGLRQMLNQLLDERERGKAARLRASLHDRD